jgi:hypothetical protein
LILDTGDSSIILKDVSQVVKFDSSLDLPWFFDSRLGCVVLRLIQEPFFRSPDMMQDSVFYSFIVGR